MSSKTQQQTQQSQQQTNNPWSAQKPYLTQAFKGASEALNTAQSNAVIPSQFTASFTPDQIAAFQQMQQTGMGSSIPNSSSDAGGILSSAGATGAAGALNGLSGWTPQGGTQSNIDAANAYAGQQPISAMTAAAMQDANNQAQYFTKPGINAADARNGNINSSRNAIQQGLVDKGLAETAGNISANLRGQAYTQGLNLAEQNSQSNNANTLSALMAQLSGGTAAANAGTGANSGAVSQQGGLYDIATGGIAGQNVAAQAPLTNAAQAFTANTNDPYAALQNFYNIVGGNNWGGTQTGSGTSTSTQAPSTWQTIGGLLTAGGSLLGGFNLSDARSKRHIEKVGELDDGQNVYRYQYLNNPVWHIGLLAQEVEKLIPEAVTEIHGVKYVNYKIATQHAV